MKKELLIWIVILITILSFFIYLINKLLNLYGEEYEKHKDKRKYK